MCKSSNQNQQITVLVLAGGQGKRMKGLDKGLQPFQGKPMIARVIDEIASHTSNIIISANRNLSLYESLGYPVYPDEKIDFSGPLAGFLSGLHHCSTPYMATVPCDAPFFNYEVIRQLSVALEKHDADIAVATTEIDRVLRIQSVFTLMKTSVAVSLEEYLKNGNHKISPWFKNQKSVSVLFKDESLFININTIEELETADVNKQY